MIEGLDWKRAQYALDSAVGTVLEKSAGATAWRLELLSFEQQCFHQLSSRGEAFVLLDDDGAELPSANERIAANFYSKPSGTSIQRCSVAKIGDRLAREGEDWALTFSTPISDSWQLCGEVLFEETRSGIVGWAGEQQLVDVLSKMALASVAVVDRARHASALQELLGMHAAATVIVNETGHVVIDLRPEIEPNARVAERQPPFPLTRSFLSKLVAETKMAFSAKQRDDETPPYFYKTVRSNEHIASAVYVVPLSSPQELGSHESLYAVLFPVRSGGFRKEILEDAFSLTPAEAKVVGRILDGKQIKEVSEELSLSLHTVRTYLKRSYIKVGVNNQPQLISRVNKMAVPLRQ